jgi:hypothetical protein
MKYFQLFEQFTQELNESIYDIVGRKQLRVVIEGDPVAKNHEVILAAMLKADNENSLKFFDATGKIVGNITKVRLDAIKRDLRSISKDITIREKK